MQRAQGDALLDSLDDLVVNDAGIKEFHTAVEHTVTDSVDLVNGLDNTVLRIYQDLQNSGNGLRVAGHGDILNNLLFANLVGQTAVDINTLAQALSGHIAGLGIHQLILKRRAAGIDNQNIHWNLPPKIKNVFLFIGFMIR
jgi:hypothetical protein